MGAAEQPVCAAVLIAGTSWPEAMVSDMYQALYSEEWKFILIGSQRDEPSVQMQAFLLACLPGKIWKLFEGGGALRRTLFCVNRASGSRVLSYSPH